MDSLDDRAKLTGRTARIGRLLAKGPAVYGLDVARIAHSLRGIPGFARSLADYRHAQQEHGGLPSSVRNLQPHLADASAPAGDYDPEYFYQDWWVAREIFRRSPGRHVDIGSRLDGFVSHLLVFREVEFIDVRRVRLDIPGFSSRVADARSLHGIDNASVESLSCLHVIEHIGLGRYGDEIDPRGSESAAGAICRVLAAGGYAYVSTPVGRERLQFNGQRVFAPTTVPLMFRGLELHRFSAVGDDGRFAEDAHLDDYSDADHACGIYVFRKPEGASAVDSR